MAISRGRRAVRYVIMNLGDALSVGAPQLQGEGAEAVWNIRVLRAATRERCGELRLSAESGEVVAWLPADSATESVTP